MSKGRGIAELDKADQGESGLPCVADFALPFPMLNPSDTPTSFGKSNAYAHPTEGVQGAKPSWLGAWGESPRKPTRDQGKRAPRAQFTQSRVPPVRFELTLDGF